MITYFVLQYIPISETKRFDAFEVENVNRVKVQSIFLTWVEKESCHRAFKLLWLCIASIKMHEYWHTEIHFSSHMSWRLDPQTVVHLRGSTLRKYFKHFKWRLPPTICGLDDNPSCSSMVQVLEFHFSESNENHRSI